MKKLLILTTSILTIALSSTIFANSVSKMIEVYTAPNAIYVNNTAITTDSFLYEGTTYVPLRDITEAMGANVNFDGDNKRIDITSSSNIAVKPNPDTTTDNDNTTATTGNIVDFDGFTITFGTDYKWTKVENQFSDLDGKDVFLVPINIKNNTGETASLNMFYYTFFGPSGNELDSVSFYIDEASSLTDKMRPNAQLDAYFAVLYDGDGNYDIVFDNFSQQEEYSFAIKK